MWGMIATWRMALEGVKIGTEKLSDSDSITDAIIEAIQEVENTAFYKSVGYGGLPNQLGEVELDAGYMDGDTLDVGAVMALQDFESPIAIAKELSKLSVNNVLVGQGANLFAQKNGFKSKKMLTKRATEFYEERLRKQNTELKAYDGHDTVGVVGLDNSGKMVAATSTSGLFMKQKGRVGDSALVGSGYYAKSSVGGACATGLGEDLMKGCISYEIVRLMEEGLHPQVACDRAVNKLDQLLKATRNCARDLSVVAMNNKGEFGASSNINEFSYVVASQCQPLTCFVVRKIDGVWVHEVASDEWLEEYMNKEKASAFEEHSL